MLFFRSEEALKEWLTSNKAERGHVFTIPQLWKISQRWYQNRMSPDFHGRTLDQVKAIFHEFELMSEFWQII
jgi:hypothetical protein